MSVQKISQNAPPRAVLLFVRDLIRCGHLPNVGPQRGAAKAVLVALATWANPNGTNACPSMQHLANATCFSRATVKRQLLRLAAAGVITEIQGATPHRGRTWTINVGAIEWKSADESP